MEVLMKFLTVIFVICLIVFGYLLFDEDDWRGRP